MGRFDTGARRDVRRQSARSAEARTTSNPPSERVPSGTQPPPDDREWFPSRTSPLRARSDRRGPPCQASCSRTWPATDPEAAVPRRKLVRGPARRVGGLAGGAASDTVPGRQACRRPGSRWRVRLPMKHAWLRTRRRAQGARERILCSDPHAAGGSAHSSRREAGRSRRGAVDASRAQTGGRRSKRWMKQWRGGGPVVPMVCLDSGHVAIASSRSAAPPLTVW